jgi:hypothetical protein
MNMAKNGMVVIGFDENGNFVNTEDSSYKEYRFDEEEPEAVDDEKKRGYVFSEIKRKPIYISPERAEKILSEMNCVVVHDFGDEYHLSEAERQARNKFYETFKIIRRAKKNYKRLDEYIRVMRDALKCLDAVAQTNGVYDPLEFKLKFLRDEISITGLKFPKYRGKDKKDISWEYLCEFILSDEDPSKIIKRHGATEFQTDDEIEANAERLFSKKELEYILKEENDRPDRYFDPDEEDAGEEGFALILSDKNTRRIMKSQPEFLSVIKDIKRSQRSVSHLNSSFAYDLNMDALEQIEKYDRKHSISIVNTVPEFTGDIMNDDDYFRYLASLREYEEQTTTVNFAGKCKSLSDARDLTLRAAFEDCGWDIRAFNGNREREKKLKKASKKDEKRRKELKKKLLQIEKRQSKRSELGYGKKKKKKKKMEDD